MLKVEPYSIRQFRGRLFIPAAEVHGSLVTWQAFEPWLLSHAWLAGAQPREDVLFPAPPDPTGLTGSWVSLELAGQILTQLPEDMDGQQAAARLQVTRALVQSGGLAWA